MIHLAGNFLICETRAPPAFNSSQAETAVYNIKPILNHEPVTQAEVKKLDMLCPVGHVDPSQVKLGKKIYCLAGLTSRQDRGLQRLQGSALSTASLPVCNYLSTYAGHSHIRLMLFGAMSFPIHALKKVCIGCGTRGIIAW